MDCLQKSFKATPLPPPLTYLYKTKFSINTYKIIFFKCIFTSPDILYLLNKTYKDYIYFENWFSMLIFI